MAQTGYTPISIYYSSTASNTPTAGNLVAGELAINTADGKLFYKDSSGVVQVIAGKGGAGVAGGSTTQVQYNSSGSLAGSANMTYSTSGGMTINGVTQGYNTTLYTVDGALSNYSASNGVYLNGNRGGWLGLQADGTQNTYMELYGSTATSPNAISFFTNTTLRMRITSAGDVGIGATSPAATLDVASSLSKSGAGPTNIYSDLRINAATTGTSSILNARVVGLAGSYTIAGAAAIYVSPFVMQTGVTATNTYGVYIGDVGDGGAGGSVTNKWGVYQTGSSNQNYFAGNTFVGKTSSSDNVVGIYLPTSGASAFTMAASTNAASTLNIYSTGASAYRFYVTMDGKIYCTSTTIAGISDQRLKENVRDLDVGLDAIMAVKPRRFDWKEGKGQDKKNAVGFVAQEFETVFPNSVTPSKAGEDGIEYKTVCHEELIPAMVKAIQELNAKVDAQAVEIATLKAK
jgi:hypothetical protein